MVNITLEYQPFRFLKYTRKINGSFPSAFDELKPAQLIAITGLINQTTSETAFLNIMTGIKKFRIKKLDDYHRYRLMLLFEPLTEIYPYHAFIIPHINTPIGGIVSPKPKLSGITFGQFIFAESYFTSYQTDKNPIDLHKFVASLYLPKNLSFNENEIRFWDLDNKKVKPEILDAIVINYVLIKEWLANVYPMIFQTEQETDEPKTHKKPGNSAWLKIFESVVGDDLVNHDRYALLPLHNVLRWMTNKIKENIKNKIK